MKDLKGQEKIIEKKVKIKDDEVDEAFQFQIERVISFKVEELSAQEIIESTNQEKEKLRVYEIKIDEKRNKLIELSKQMKDESKNLLNKRKDLELFQEKMFKKFESSNSGGQDDKNDLYSYFQELYGKLEKERAELRKQKEEFEKYRKEIEATINEKLENYKKKQDEKEEKKVMENIEKDKIEHKKEEGDSQKANEELDQKHEEKRDKEKDTKQKRKGKRRKK